MLLNTALLIFSRTAAQEALNKDLSGSGNWKLNRKIADVLIMRTKQFASETGMPYFVADGSGSEKTDLAGRLKHSIKEVIDQGYERVIVIPNDQPELSQKHLSALTNTSENIAWIGNKRGGIGAFSITDTAFRSFDFESYKWNSKFLHAQFASSIGEQFPRQVDLDLIDINNEADLAAYISLFRHGSFSLTLAGVVGSPHSYSVLTADLYKDPVSTNFPLRGPPML